ncbi:MAG TPA: NAD-dependent epimerase/dehydratase family protein [Chloroflexia bacterium]|nr:NAD-dependent epimerase/dehydratase family protein [Chloroflexia bacterium]
MKRAVITGATGFVGANLARRLLREGHEVHLLVRRDNNPWRIEEIRADVQMHEISFGDREALTRVMGMIRPDWVFHLAAHGAYSWQTDLDSIVQTNIVGTINLVEASLSAGFEAFVNTGSSSEYGYKDHAPTEREWIEPNSYYAVAKASATLFCRYTAQSQNANITTLRLYSVYGPYEEPARLVPALIMSGLQGKLPPLVNPDIARDYVFMEDVLDAYLLAATKPGQELGAVYNVGTGTQTKLSEIVEVSRRLMGISTEPEWGSMPQRGWDTNVWVADSRKLRTELGWQPRYTLDQGLSLTIEWFRDNIARLPVYLGYV